MANMAERYRQAESMLMGMDRLSEKYAGCRKVSESELPYRAPADMHESMAAAEVLKKQKIRMVILTCGFVLMAVICIAMSRTPAMVIFMLLFAALPLFLTIKTFTLTPKVVSGTVVFKRKVHRRKQGTNYYVSVLCTETGEGLICSRLEISARDFDRAAEGVPVVVVKTAGMGVAVL
ncbi:MAG: hypothetical protein IJ806_11770 [Ruminococcus sp.]|nr:hypothetical protein [Ruminococcus sp.]